MSRTHFVLAGSLSLAAVLMSAAARTKAADLWGGSAALASDYLVRGISRSSDQAALQADLHFVSTSGVVAGVFASTAQFDSNDRREVELNPFLGFTLDAGNEWRAKILAGHYSYPWNRDGTRYDYDELELDLSYQGWLSFSAVYSPNSPRDVPHRGLIGVAATATEVNLQLPLRRKLFATGGVGYTRVNGPDAEGYTYWSLGAGYDLAPATLAVSYVNTTSGAKGLYYNAAAGARWLGTVIWRF